MADPAPNMAMEFLAMQLSANNRPGSPRWWCMRKTMKDKWRAAAEELIERWVRSETEAEARATAMGLHFPAAPLPQMASAHTPGPFIDNRDPGDEQPRLQ